MSKALKNGRYVDVVQKVNPSRKKATADTTPENALNEFITTLASSDTNSIAKIRAAAQKFIEQTENV